jgi:hypothetical protein
MAQELGLTVHKVGPHGLWLSVVNKTSGHLLESRDLLVMEKRRFHLLLLSKDLTSMAHIHPEDYGQEEFGSVIQFSIEFPAGGEYLAAVALKPQKNPKSHYLSTHFHVVKRPQQQEAQVPTESQWISQIEPISFTNEALRRFINVSQMNPPLIQSKLYHKSQGFLKSQQCQSFVLYFPSWVELREYLDEAAHLALVDSNFLYFVHVHGSFLPMDCDSGGHVHHQSISDIESMSEQAVKVYFTAVFPFPGTYRLFAQTVTKVNQMLISPFWLVVQ